MRVLFAVLTAIYDTNGAPAENRSKTVAEDRPDPGKDTHGSRARPPRNSSALLGGHAATDAYRSERGCLGDCHRRSCGVRTVVCKSSAAGRTHTIVQESDPGVAVRAFSDRHWHIRMAELCLCNANCISPPGILPSFFSKLFIISLRLSQLKSAVRILQPKIGCLHFRFTWTVFLQGRRRPQCRLSWLNHPDTMGRRANENDSRAAGEVPAPE